MSCTSMTLLCTIKYIRESYISIIYENIISEQLVNNFDSRIIILKKYIIRKITNFQFDEAIINSNNNKFILRSHKW